MLTTTKRPRGPSMDESCGTAALLVLTNPQLFRAIQTWSTAFPQLLRAKWLAVERTLREQHCRRGRTELGISKKRQAELFMRELMVRGDLATLKLAASARWRDPKTGESGGFPVHKLQFAIRASQAAMLRWAFESTKTVVASRHTITWFWDEAIAHYDGSCEVFDVLADFARPTDSKFAYLSARLLSLPVAKWVVDKAGPEHLAEWFLDSAARPGDVALVQYLWTIPGQDVHEVVRKADSYCESVREFVKQPAECVIV